jgi:hypothetical protein
VVLNNVKKWCGLFGSYHISTKKDGLFDDTIKLENNFYHNLLKSKLNYNKSEITRIELCSYQNLFFYRSVVSDEFSEKYVRYYDLINKKKCIYFYKNDINWFLFKK